MVNALTTNGEDLIHNVNLLKTSMSRMFSLLSKHGLVKAAPVRVGERIMAHLCKGKCLYHPGRRDHGIEQCKEFRGIVQRLLDHRVIEVGFQRTSEQICMMDEPFEVWYEDSSVSNDSVVIWVDDSMNGETNATSKAPLEVQFNAPSGSQPFEVIFEEKEKPSQLPVKDTKSVPWNYGGDHKEAVNDIAGVGRITRSGRYSQQTVVNEKKDTKEAEAADKNVQQKPKEVVSDQEAEEFLRIIKQSEYSVVQQLNATPSKISILSLLMSSDSHRKALMDVLKRAYVQSDITVANLEGVTNNIMNSRLLTFTDEEIPQEGRGHNKALHITATCKGCTIARVLVDNGSSLNVMPKFTLDRIPAAGSLIRASEMIVKAFDGGCRTVMGEVELPVTIGPCTFNINFQVMDIPTSYSCLLGRPWIHCAGATPLVIKNELFIINDQLTKTCAGAVPSTLHQQIKFAVDDQLIVINAEDDILVTKATNPPYIEAVEEARESTFRSFEVVHVNHSMETPKLSVSALMIGKVLKVNGFTPNRGLGKQEQGTTTPLEVKSTVGKYGLGYQPTKEDKRKAADKRKLQGRPQHKRQKDEESRVVYPHLNQSFRSGGFVDKPLSLPQFTHLSINMIGMGRMERKPLILPWVDNVLLRNWTSTEIPHVWDINDV